MAQEILAGEASLVMGESGGIGQVVAALHRLHAAYVMERLHNSPASDRAVAIRPQCQSE